MGLELNIKPEDVEELVKDSIMKAGFGKVVENAITKALSGYNNPIDEAVKGYVAIVARQLLEEKFEFQIREAVTMALTERVTKDFINSVVEAATDKMIKAANDRY